MKAFFDSYECRSGVHCQTCRATDAVGHAFRRSIADAFNLDNVTWLCPHDRPWNHQGPGDKLPMPIVDKTPLAARRRAICDACFDRPTCQVFRNEATRPCEAANYLALPGSICLAKPARWAPDKC